MKHHTKIHLIKKGWRPQDLIKAESIIDKDSNHSKKFSRRVFLSSLFLVLFGTMVVAFLLIPLLIFLESFLIYIFITMLSLSLGFMYNLLINEIGFLKKKHHLLSVISLFILSLSSMFLLVSKVNQFISKNSFGNLSYEPFLISIIFSFSFITPYIISLIKLKYQKKRHKIN